MGNTCKEAKEKYNEYTKLAAKKGIKTLLEQWSHLSYVSKM